MKTTNSRLDIHEIFVRKPTDAQRCTMLRQACHNAVASMLQRQLQWGPTLIVLGVYSRTVLEQQARAFHRPLVKLICAP